MLQSIHASYITYIGVLGSDPHSTECNGEYIVHLLINFRWQTMGTKENKNLDKVLKNINLINKNTIKSKEFPMENTMKNKWEHTVSEKH